MVLEGIRQNYPSATFLSEKARALIANSRLFTGMAPLLGGILTMIMCLAYYDNLELIWSKWGTMIFAGVTLMLLNFAGNNINSIYDMEIDRKNKPYRPLVRGLLTVDDVRSFAWILVLFCVARSFTINTSFGIMCCVLTVFAVFYSMPPVRFKKRLLLNNLWQAAARGQFGIVAAWCVFGRITDPVPWVAGSIIFVWMCAAQVTKDFSDVLGDKEFGIQTLPVRFGADGARVIMGLFFAGSFILLFIYWNLGWLPHSSWWLIWLAVPSLYMISDDTEFSRMENSVSWLLFYFTLILWFLGFTIVFLIN